MLGAAHCGCGPTNDKRDMSRSRLHMCIGCTRGAHKMYTCADTMHTGLPKIYFGWGGGGGLEPLFQPPPQPGGGSKGRLRIVECTYCDRMRTAGAHCAWASWLVKGLCCGVQEKRGHARLDGFPPATQGLLAAQSHSRWAVSHVGPSSTAPALTA